MYSISIIVHVVASVNLLLKKTVVVVVGPFEQKPVKNFREKGAWAYTGPANLLGWGTPYYLRKGKSYGFQI